MRNEPTILPSRAAAALALAATGQLAACISDPPGLGIPPMCEVSVDCDQAAGEICDEGVCWGDPPELARFAALLAPPVGRNDLPVAVVPLLTIAPDGTMSGLDFPEAVAVRGRVLLACPEGSMPSYPCGEGASVGAQILIERTTWIAGGPPYRRTVMASAGVGPGEDGFAFLLPLDPEAEYRVTIQPDDDVGGIDIAPGEIAPPRQIILAADGDRAVDWILGEPTELKSIHGCVQNVVGDGKPYASMRVVAYGRWTELSPLERASSRSLTGEDGCFELSVPRKMLDEFDISVQPPAGVTLPSFTLRGEFVRDPPEGEHGTPHVIDPPLVMPIAPAPTTFRLPIEARSISGGPERVVGADVRLTTSFPSPSLNLDRTVEITYSAQAVTTGADDPEPGMAQVQLYPGDENNRRYLVSVVPPAGSPFQSAFEREVTVGIGGAEVLEALTLERRTAVSGLAIQASGDPVVDAPVEATPSALFHQLLADDGLRKTVAELPFPTATTDPNGEFVLWLDRELVGQAALYDLDVTPAIFSGAPSWSFEDVEMPAEGESLSLGKRRLPEASFARAVVRDGRGDEVAGAEVHVYQLPPADYCSGKPADCAPPSRLRGVWQSDENGWVRVVLPDP